MDSKGSNQIYNIDLPTTKPQVEKLRAGDLVYLSGCIITGRDHFHKRILEYEKDKKSLPITFEQIKGSALYHMGPIVKKTSEMSYKIISGGPTTSARMNSFQTKVAQILDIRFVIGKGGMSNVSWSNIPAVYLQYPGGAGAIVSKFIKKVVGVEWIDLGTPEAGWILEVEKFGPLLVAIDSYGNSLYS